jgi:hypothetical protein
MQKNKQRRLHFQAPLLNSYKAEITFCFTTNILSWQIRLRLATTELFNLAENCGGVTL